MALNSLPGSILRAKGLLYLQGGKERSTILQLVGRRWSLEPGPSWKGGNRLTALVAIGPAGLLDTEQVEATFAGALEDGSSNGSA